MALEPLIPEIQRADNAEDFKTIVEIGRALLRKLRKLDYEVIYAELAALKATTSEGVTLQQLMADLGIVQSAKDRVAELATDVLRHASSYRRVADLLTDGWVRFSEAKSEGARRGEATLMMVNFENAAMEAETVNKAVMGVLRNLDSKQEFLSRQITCFGMMLKLRDISRTSPNFEDFPRDFGMDTPLIGRPTPIVPAELSTGGPVTNLSPATSAGNDAARQESSNWKAFLHG